MDCKKNCNKKTLSSSCLISRHYFFPVNNLFIFKIINLDPTLMIVCIYWLLKISSCFYLSIKYDLKVDHVSSGIITVMVCFTFIDDFFSLRLFIFYFWVALYVFYNIQHVILSKKVLLCCNVSDQKYIKIPFDKKKME